MTELTDNLSLTELLSENLEASEGMAFELGLDENVISQDAFDDEEQYAYRLGQIAFFAPRDTLSEVIEDVNYAHLPLMPDTVLGLCNVRGNLVPVFNLHQFLDVELAGKKRHLLCIGDGDDMVGVLLDDMPFRVKRNECKALRSAPIVPPSVQPFISQVYIKGDQIILDYQHEDMFSSLCN